jgi:AcrR family transcriptional regulator
VGGQDPPLVPAAALVPDGGPAALGEPVVRDDAAPGLRAEGVVEGEPAEDVQVVLGFTIAALCERAGVPPRALYARAATKDALFLAVYERGMTRVLAGHEVFAEHDRWDFDDDRRRVEQAVRHLVTIFLDHAAFLRAVVLISGAHPEVRRRGEAYRNALGELFTSVLAPLDGHPDRDFCFALIFSAMVVRTAYGPGFGLAGDPEVLIQDLVTMAQRYLLATRP